MAAAGDVLVLVFRSCVLIKLPAVVEADCRMIYEGRELVAWTNTRSVELRIEVPPEGVHSAKVGVEEAVNEAGRAVDAVTQ